jgi:hypothetical protein
MNHVTDFMPQVQIFFFIDTHTHCVLAVEILRRIAIQEVL